MGLVDTGAVELRRILQIQQSDSKAGLKSAHKLTGFVGHSSYSIMSQEVCTIDTHSILRPTEVNSNHFDLSISRSLLHYAIRTENCKIRFNDSTTFRRDKERDSDI